MTNVWFLCFLIYIRHGNAQYYAMPLPINQNANPYPYQTAFGLNPPSPGLPNPQNMGIPYPGVPGPGGNGIPNLNQTAFNPQLPQQGGPAYQYPGMGYPIYQQPYFSQGPGYPQFGGGYQQVAPGYPIGFGQPGIGYPQQTNTVTGQQMVGANDGIKTEIVDVSPEYQRQILGWPAGGSSTSGANETIKPINLHIINGQQVTTTVPPTTTANENVEETTPISTVKPSGRRFMDVPESCPKGSMLAQNGKCIVPFSMRNPKKNATDIEEDEEITER